MLIDFAGAYTFAFWSLKDCPIPSDLDLDSVEYNIGEALEYLGYCGNVEFRRYDGEDLDVHQLSWEIVRYVSAFCHTRTNLVVISKNIQKISEFFRVLHALSIRRCNVLLVQPPESASESMFQTAESVRACIKRLDGGDPMIIRDSSDDDMSAASEADCDA